MKTAVDVAKEIFPLVTWKLSEERLIGNVNNSVYIEIYKPFDKKNQLICRIKNIFNNEITLLDEYTNDLEDLEFKLVTLKVDLFKIDVAFVALLEVNHNYKQFITTLIPEDGYVDTIN